MKNTNHQPLNRKWTGPVDKGGKLMSLSPGLTHFFQWGEDEKREQIEIRDYLKYKTLEAEMTSSQTELQTLRFG